MSDKEQRAWEELHILQDSSLRIYQMYLNWVTWFYGINIVAMTLVLTSEKLRSELVTSFSLLMIFLLLLGIGASLKMRTHYIAATQRAHALGQLISHDPPDVATVFGEIIGRYTSWSSPTALASALIGWGYIAYKFTTLPI